MCKTSRPFNVILRLLYRSYIKYLSGDCLFQVLQHKLLHCILAFCYRLWFSIASSLVSLTCTVYHCAATGANSKTASRLLKFFTIYVYAALIRSKLYPLKKKHLLIAEIQSENLFLLPLTGLKIYSNETYLLRSRLFCSRNSW